MKRIALNRPSLIHKAIRGGKLKGNRYVPESEKSSRSAHRNNLDGSMLFDWNKRIRPLMKKSTGIPDNVKGLT